MTAISFARRWAAAETPPKRLVPSVTTTGVPRSGPDPDRPARPVAVEG
jgi:hypothetical protein